WPWFWAELADLVSSSVDHRNVRSVLADALPAPLWAALPALARWSATAVVRWMTTRLDWAARAALPRGLARRVHEVDDATLAPLCEGLVRVAPTRFAELVARLPYPRRGALFEAAVAPLSLQQVEWPTALLEVLPHDLREREATRMLELRRAQEHAQWRRELLGFRDIDQARPLLERESKAAAATERAEAHVALVRSTSRSRRGMPQTLAWLQRIRNDQDPVRQAVLGALARVPGQLFDDRDALDAVVAPIFDARDTSYATRHAAASLAKRLMTAHATAPRSPMFELGVSLLSRLAGQGGTLDLPPLHDNLPRGAEQAIVDALMPWLRADSKRQREQGIFRLWQALGKRAWRVSSLGALMERLVWEGHHNNAGFAAGLWIQDPATRDERVRALVARDRSALYLHGVFAHCHRRRQSTLFDRFADPPPKGRFHDGKIVIIPHVARGLERWTPALQRTFCTLLDRADLEPKRYSRTRAALVALRARVPLTEVSDLEPALRSSDVNVIEAALGAMVWTDRPAPALPILLDHLDGDRARVAMYAMPRLARLLPPAEVVDALATLLQRPRLKVTVHKEALRLLGHQPRRELELELGLGRPHLGGRLGPRPLEREALGRLRAEGPLLLEQAPLVVVDLRGGRRRAKREGSGRARASDHAGRIHHRRRGARERVERARRRTRRWRLGGPHLGQAQRAHPHEHQRGEPRPAARVLHRDRAGRRHGLLGSAAHRKQSPSMNWQP
ncbi:MAG: hypothetical protein KDK70_17515, partial [Myxococcales bacterium]|nr:hypothetical protein [Myxococcales bacterium]